MLCNAVPGVPITILIEEGDIVTNLRAVTEKKRYRFAGDLAQYTAVPGLAN